MNKMKFIGIALIVSLFITTGCSLGNLVDIDKHPIGNDIDQKYLETKLGALGLLNSTLGSLQDAISVTSLNVGVLTDELASVQTNSRYYIRSLGTAIDSRTEPDNHLIGRGIPFAAYGTLQTARVRAGYARYFLKRQSDASLNYAISASYSYEGYAIIILAENLCSGIPLSDVQYGKEAVYGKSISTDSLFKVAISKFDSALAIDHDSTRFKVLAKTGKARALMSIGRYHDAANTVDGIEQDNTFKLSYTEVRPPNTNSMLDAFWSRSDSPPRGGYLGQEIVSGEGNNGIVWYTDPNNLDPRVPVSVQKVGDTYIFPLEIRQTKFSTGTVSFNLASWIEAKLIESEYLLSIDDPNWITPLNEVRSTVGLSDTTSPPNKMQQVNLLFRERAFWFYGHGTRLSDMRRLVRQYGRSVNSVFPSGGYPRSIEIFTYGDAVVFIPSLKEFTENYAYSGCINKQP